MLTIFGDSIAHGGADGGWPLRIRKRLWDCGLGDQVYTQAVPGHTSGDLVRRMPIELPLHSTETIVIAIGTNDAQRLYDDAHPRFTDQEFRNNLSTCVQLAKQYARWVVLMSPYGLATQQPKPHIRHITPKRLQDIAQVVAEVADSHACWHSNVMGLLTDEHFFPDAVHPLPSGHDVIARHVWNDLRKTGCLGSPDSIPVWDE